MTFQKYIHVSIVFVRLEIMLGFLCQFGDLFLQLILELLLVADVQNEK